MNGHSHIASNGQTQTNGPVPSTSQGSALKNTLAGVPSVATAAAPSAGASTPTYHSSYGQSVQNSQDAVRDADLGAYLLSEGFSNGRFADCRLDVHIANSTRVMYMLHKIILARSPVLLARIEKNSGQDIVLQIKDENVTQESLLIVLGYLYSSQARYRIQPSNAKAVLAAAVFLGQQDLADQAAELCRQTIIQLSDPSEVLNWIRFLEASDQQSEASQWLYGQHASMLHQTLMHHLVHVLPTTSSAFATTSQTPSSGMISAPSNKPGPSASQEAQQRLLGIYALLPFSIFKAIIESPQFPPGDMERFAFAKRCISERKRLQGPVASSESAVLAFGNSGASDKASNVEVVSKGRRGRQFWKVGE